MHHLPHPLRQMSPQEQRNPPRTIREILRIQRNLRIVPSPAIGSSHSFAMDSLCALCDLCANLFRSQTRQRNTRRDMDRGEDVYFRSASPCRKRLNLFYLLASRRLGGSKNEKRSHVQNTKSNFSTPPARISRHAAKNAGAKRSHLFRSNPREPNTRFRSRQWAFPTNRKQNPGAKRT